VSSEAGDGHALLLTGRHEFFLEEAAEEFRAAFCASGVEHEKISDERLSEDLAVALSNGSLFSSRRLVEADLTPVFGTASPGALWDEARAAWAKGSPSGRREAFRKARALAAALRLDLSDPEAAADAAARKARRKEGREDFAEILRELPDPQLRTASVAEAVTAHLERGDPSTFLLARALDPPRGSELLRAFEKHGAVRAVDSGPDDHSRLLAARARRLASARKIEIDPGALERLLDRTEADPRLFSGELEKLFEWAGPGGRLRAADVEAMVEDRRSEEIYGFVDALGRRDRAEILPRLARILSGRRLRARERSIESEDPLRAFFGLLVAEVRRLLIVRARCEDSSMRIDPKLSFPAYRERVHPRLSAPPEPFSDTLLEGNPFLWYKVYQRAAGFSLEELEQTLVAASELDAASKESASIEDAATMLVSALAGPARPTA
jgi:DNA polymerase III delta subunit